MVLYPKKSKMKTRIIIMYACLMFSYNVCEAHTNQINNKNDSISFKIKITAIDLSEDGLAGASQNDEVFFFLYRQNNSLLPQLIVSDYFVLDTSNRVKSIAINTATILPNDTLTFILIEKDTKKSEKGIEPICRFYLNEMYTKYEKNKMTNFEEYFDDDDVLGMYRITGDKFQLSKPIIKKFETLNFFDWSIYRLEISK